MFARVALFALTFSAYAYGVVIDRTLVAVNNEVILQSDVDHFYRTLGLRKELDPLFGFSGEPVVEGSQRTQMSDDKILEFLVQEKLIGQSFKISDTDVEQEVVTVQRNTNLDREQLVSFLRSKGFEFNEYFELMRIGIQKRNLIEKEIRSRVNISDDDIRNHFTNVVAKSAAIPVEYNIQVILINPKNYQKNEFAVEAAQKAWQAVKQGEPFGDVARRVSDDESANNGGEFGYLRQDLLNPELREIVQKLQIGQVSGVIKANRGYFIVKLIDSRSSETEKFNEMKEVIREQLAKEEYRKQLFLWAERSKNTAYIHNSPK